jgi:hypothetical protein
MNSVGSKLVVASLGVLLVAGVSQAAGIDSDDASAAVYADGWDNFDDGSVNPNGLGGWILGGGAVDGSTIDITSSLGIGGGSGAIDSAGVSFKLHDTSGGFVDVFRFFDPSGLDAGETLSLDMVVNFRGGFKGIDLRSDAGDATIFNFNIGGDDYNVDQAASGNGSIGNAYSDDTVFSLAFTQTSLAGGTWSIARSGGVTDLDSGTYAGRAKSFKLYSGSQGSFGQDALYVNNLAITPEPASLALLGIGGLAMLKRRG